MGRKGENIFHRKDGRWEARYVKGYSLSGKCQYGYLYGKSYQEVKNKRVQVLLNSKVPTKQSNYNNTLFKEKIELWLKQQRFSVKLSTYTYYYCVVYKHIIPTLGDILVLNITEPVIFSFIETLVESQKFKMTTIHEIAGVLKQILEFCDIRIRFKLPKREKKKINTLSLKQKQQLESHICSNFNDITIGILLSLYAGLRIGEVCALTWSDIDFSSGFIQISKTVSRVKNFDKNKKSKTQLILSSAKTESAFRLIPINKQFISVLRKYKTAKKSNDDFFILSSSRQFMDPRNYYNQYKAILKNVIWKPLITMHYGILLPLIVLRED